MEIRTTPPGIQAPTAGEWRRACALAPRETQAEPAGLAKTDYEQAYAKPAGMAHPGGPALAPPSTHSFGSAMRDETLVLQARKPHG